MIQSRGIQFRYLVTASKRYNPFFSLNYPLIRDLNTYYNLFISALY